MTMDANGYFHDRLASWGDRTALLSEDGGAISYVELARRADAFGASLDSRLNGRRGFLVLEITNTAEAIIAYLGALRARWPVALVAEGRGEPDSDLVTGFQPDLIRRMDGRLVPGPGSLEGLHPDLGVLLSTSGSTGSTKLVRLSYRNIHENARSIAEYLDLTPDRVAVTTLPMHYTYGLSVLHSFLLAGARIVLTDGSVIAPGFRELVDRTGVTDLAGVPYTYELFERSDFRSNPPASLKAMTQAGGRLPPYLVEEYGKFARDHGHKFFVMYGQTEATARMAWLPPDQVLSNSDCIGIPIPRGEFELRAGDGSVINESGIAGELIYRGPNVMMGYGLKREDLAKGPELTELATGDIAERCPNGFYRIVGRMSRFAKIAGLRIGFDEVERILREGGFDGEVTGNDHLVLLALRKGDPEAACNLIAEKCGIPAITIFAWPLNELPVLASGKIDYVTLRETGLSLAAEARRNTGKEKTIAGLFGRAMNRSHLSEDESFASLGGDSLAYVAASIGVEELLGTSPAGWESIPIRELQAMADAYALEESASPIKRRRKLTIGMDVPLRLLAISLVFIGHGYPEKTEMLRGGANVLFALAGYSMAAIHLPMLLDGRVAPFLRSTFTRLVIPYLLAVTLLLPVTSTTANSISWYTLTSTIFLDADQRGLFYSFWFIESLIHMMVLTCVLFMIPLFRVGVQHRPFVVMIVLVLLATALRVIGREYWPNGANDVNLTMDGWLYCFFLGWAAWFASDFRKQALVVALAAIMAFDQFGLMTGRSYWLTAALAVLLAVPSLRLNSRLCWFLVHVSGATYFMYICHPVVGYVLKVVAKGFVPPVLYSLLLYVSSVMVGFIAAELWRRLLTGLQKIQPGRSVRRAPSLPDR